jgi:hypothetical protein
VRSKSMRASNIRLKSNIVGGIYGRSD